MKIINTNDAPSMCSKCGGYIDHYSLTCIHCLTEFTSQSKAADEGMDEHKIYRDLYNRIVGCDDAALGELFELANNDDAEALLMLGMLFDPAIGNVFKTNVDVALGFYEKAANLGHARSQFFLASMYKEGGDIPQNFVLAREWFFKSATNGDVDAQMHYARMLQTGNGGYQNLEEAADWYGQASKQGDAPAATNLGIMHYERLLKDSSDDIALNLFKYAAEQLDGLAHYFLGLIFSNGRGVVRDENMSLYHFCIAVLLLPEGNNKNDAIKLKEHCLMESTKPRDLFENGALEFLKKKNYMLPS